LFPPTIKKGVDMSQQYTACVSGGLTGVGTAYSTSKRASVSVSFSLRSYFLSNLKSIQLDISNRSGSGTPTTVSVQISSDENGDEIILPDTSATISAGVTTALSGGAVIAVDTVLYSSSETLYIFVKGNSGTMDIDSVTLNVENN